ncbi:MAG: hypothetical protein CSA53_05575 [Gammaproteobacteria bacterium]|nr:MAG: hypothetical protein CSA53_05575 [Gammaproteobacteria bacterium]
MNTQTPNIPKPAQASGKRHFFNILILLLVVGGLLICMLYWKAYQSLHRDIDSHYAVETANKRALLSAELRKVENVIDTLIRSEAFATYLNKPDAKHLQHARQLFGFVAAEHRNYLQVRYIDKEGEVLVAAGSLQSGSVPSEEYDLIADLSGGSFWYSELTLRREDGEIAQPQQPILRVGKAVYLHGLPQGAMLITLDVSGLLDALVESIVFDLSLVDDQGRYIYSSEKGKSWSEALGRSDSIYDSYPDLVLRNNTELKRKTSFFSSFSRVLPNAQQSYLVMHYRQNLPQALRRDYFTTALLGSGVLGLLCWWLASRFTRMQDSCQELLQYSDARAQMYFGVMDDHLLTLEVNSEGRIQDVSSALCKRGHYEKAELRGKLYSFLLEAPDPTRSAETLESLENPWQLEGEAVGHTRSGEKFWVNQMVRPAEDENGKPLCYTLILDDVSDKKELERRSVTDLLTGLSNRTGLTRAMGHEWRLAKRYGTAFSVILLDLDHFKCVNDTYGYKAGDQILVKMAQLMRSTLRESDICGRFGSEEFMVILPHTDTAGASMFAEKLRESVSEHDFAIDSPVTVSMGVSGFSSSDTEADILARADLALCKAKESGGNIVVSEHSA